MPAAATAREDDDASPGSDYFNDLSQQPPNGNSNDNGAGAEDQQRESPPGEGANGQVPKPKRIACVLCRKRKLRCDGNKPSCGTCTRLQHDCSYDEVRRKSGPKRGYVKALEARLAQVETQLNKEKETPVRNGNSNGSGRGGGGQMNSMVPEYDIGVGGSMRNVLPHMQSTINRTDGPVPTEYPHTAMGNGGAVPGEEPFPWEMIGLGLDEPLPTQDIVDELNRCYFDKVHPSLPCIHRPRYYAAMNLAPHMRPPVCLRYAMWANAAAVSDKYENLSEHFYQRARKYVQQDEMKGHGESMITIAHCQTWSLLAAYEFKCMYFPRAWMSSGRASRMALMMGIHRLDGNGLDVKQCLPPPKDWTEREERRRTFWMSFCIDRYSSIGTGWPMTIDERDIMSHLPVDEPSYELSRPGSKTMQLSEALDPGGAPHLSSFGGVILMACLFGRNLLHLHRPGPDDKDDDLNGEFWKRHRQMDNIVLNTALALPDALRLPQGMNDSNVVFMNMNIHTSTICLHQAAIFKADKNRMPSRISAESKVRCITAAAEIASIMRQISHLDLCTMNPFISFCLYVAARVFVQYLKSRPKDTQIKASLQFLLSAMHAIKRKNPLTESFLVQLDVDLEGAGLENTSELRASMQPSQSYGAGRNGGPATCPNTGTQDGEGRPPTYGDIGLAVYNDPNAANRVPVTSDAPVKGSTFGSYSVPGLRQQSNQNNSGMNAFVTGGSRFELQNRQQRSPGSQQSAGISPQPFGNSTADMDTSPDGSGGNDRPTPNSSTHSQQNFSSRTSNSTYSPQNTGPGQGQIDLHTGGLPSTASIFDQSADGTSFINTTDFDMHTFTNPGSNSNEQQQQQSNGFIMWDDGPLNPNNQQHTGFTPGPSTGFTPGPSTGFTPQPSAMGFSAVEGAGMGEFGGWSEQDWNEIMAGMDGNGFGGGGGGGGGGEGAGGEDVEGIVGGGGSGGWDTHVEVDMSVEMQAHDRLARKGLLPRVQNMGWGGG